VVVVMVAVVLVLVHNNKDVKNVVVILLKEKNQIMVDYQKRNIAIVIENEIMIISMMTMVIVPPLHVQDNVHNAVGYLKIKLRYNLNLILKLNLLDPLLVVMMKIAFNVYLVLWVPITRRMMTLPQKRR
jgi:hypothetical protein